MDFVPQPLLGVIRVTLMSDARYGLADPVQHPQLLSQGFEFLSAIYRRAPEDHPYAPMWTIPVESENFENIEGSAIKSLGLLSKSFVDPISALVDETSAQIRARIPGNVGTPVHSLYWFEQTMCQARDRLRTFASTFRDAVFQCAQLQRFWLLCQAFMLYETLIGPSPPSHQNTVRRRTHRNLMGGFTTSPDTAQRLFQAGIPVWFLRPKTAIPSSVRLARSRSVCRPSTICTTPMDGGENVLFYGLAGSGHIQATCRSIILYRDVSRTPLLTVDENEHLSPISQRQYKKLTTPERRHPGSVGSCTQLSRSSRTRTYHPCR